MFNHQIFAISFARTLDLLRTPTASREQQKASFRAVFALTTLAAATLRCYEGVLTVDDVVIADDLPNIPALKVALQNHGAREVAIARGAPADELLLLLRLLAADPVPEEGLTARLRAAGASHVAVLGEQPEAVEHRSISVTQAFELAALEEAAAAAGAGGVADNGFEPTAVVPDNEVEVEPEPLLVSPAEMVEKGTEGKEAIERKEETEGRHRPRTPLEAALDRVMHDPYGPDILDRLTEASEQIHACLRRMELEPAIEAIAAIAALEPAAPEGSPRNSYGIVLRRTLTRELLVRVAKLLPDPRLAPVATAVLQRGRSDGVEVVLEQLGTAEGMRERKAYLAALRTMPHGTEQVIGMLDHKQWFVVRNIAELLGEMRVEEAVPELGRLLGHGDQRVRRAAAVALAKIGSVSTVEPLRRALKEGTPELRAMIAAGIGGPHARGLAMPLVALAESEENPDVLREYYRALGRIGTSEALQALVKAAEPGGKLLNRKSPAARIAAIDGLRAAGAAGLNALRSLADDGDKSVRAAVAEALKSAGRTASA